MVRVSIMDQFMHSLGFSLNLEKVKNPKRAPGTPVGVHVSFGGDTIVKNTQLFDLYVNL